MLNCFQIIEKYQKKRPLFSESKEWEFFYKNVQLIANDYRYSFLADRFEPFDIIRACVVIQGKLNKIAIENGEPLNNMKYFEDGPYRIYVPTLSRHDNLDLIQGVKKEYEELDCFDHYGIKLYSQYLTTLVKVYEYHGNGVFYHPFTDRLFIVNDQGRLDNRIVLFDKYMDNMNHDEILKRCENVGKAYFAYDRIGFFDSLYENNFISLKLLNILKERRL